MKLVTPHVELGGVRMAFVMVRLAYDQLAEQKKG